MKHLKFRANVSEVIEVLGGLVQAVQRAGCSIVFTQCGKSLPQRFANGLAVFEETTFFKQCRPILLVEIERLQFFQLVLDVVQIRLGL